MSYRPLPDCHTGLCRFCGDPWTMCLCGPAIPPSRWDDAMVRRFMAKGPEWIEETLSACAAEERESLAERAATRPLGSRRPGSSPGLTRTHPAPARKVGAGPA